MGRAAERQGPAPAARPQSDHPGGRVGPAAPRDRGPGSARFIEQGVSETALRIATRYLGQEEAAADVEALRGADVIVRIEPGDIRIWDYDEYSTD